MIRELAWAPGLRGFEGSTGLGQSTCMGLTSVLRQQGDSEEFKQGLEKRIRFVFRTFTLVPVEEGLEGSKLETDTVLKPRSEQQGCPPENVDLGKGVDRCQLADIKRASWLQAWAGKMKGKSRNLYWHLGGLLCHSRQMEME